MATKSKTTKKFEPVTVLEAQHYSVAFGDWLKANVSPEAANVFASIEFLELSSRTGLTPLGQKMATKSRNQINKFLGVKNV